MGANAMRIWAILFLLIGICNSEQSNYISLTIRNSEFENIDEIQKALPVSKGHFYYVSVLDASDSVITSFMWNIPMDSLTMKGDCYCYNSVIINSRDSLELYLKGNFVDFF